MNPEALIDKAVSKALEESARGNNWPLVILTAIVAILGTLWVVHHFWLAPRRTRAIGGAEGERITEELAARPLGIVKAIAITDGHVKDVDRNVADMRRENTGAHERLLEAQRQLQDAQRELAREQRNTVAAGETMRATFQSIADEVRNLRSENETNAGRIEAATRALLKDRGS